MNKIRPADRTLEITYAIRDIVVLAQQVAKSGKKLLNLNIGDPNLFDFRTPQHIIDATTGAMNANHNGYAPSTGISPAVEAIRRQAEKKEIRSVQDIFVTTGCSEAIDVCLTALVNQSENVLTPNPGYPLYTALLSKLQADEVPYFLDENNGWQPDIEDIRSKINSKTRAIVIINPNNPTGSVCSKKTLQDLIALAKAHNIVIFADEIYDKLILDGGEHTSLASLDPTAPVITFNGMSKAYLVPGFRIGWGIVSGDTSAMSDYVEAINKLLRARLSANHPEQYSISPALDGDQSHLIEVKAKLSRRRDITMEMLNRGDGISCVNPSGAFYAFPSIELDGPDDYFVRELLKETGVVVVPGSGFGQKPGTKHFRVVFLPQDDVLRSAYDQISSFYQKYKSRAAVTA